MRLRRSQVSIWPLPLTSINPLGSQTKLSLSTWYKAALIWISPGIPCDSNRLAVLTVSPQRS